MKTHLTSDLHFSHNLMKTIRKFSSIEEMNSVLIENWNNCVKPDDVIYHLGDLSFGSMDSIVDLLNSKLNGTIYLIRGNHDKQLDKAYDRGLINKEKVPWIKDYFELKVNDTTVQRNVQVICLFHYAMATWNLERYGSFAAGGHSHSGLNSFFDQSMRNKKIMDVGIDSVSKYFAKKESREVLPTDYRPISYEEIKEYMSNKNKDFEDWSV